MPFTPPKWARKVTKDMLRFRGIKSWEYGYWWIEWGGQLDTIRGALLCLNGHLTLKQRSSPPRWDPVN
jgi:hypothetical protein